MRGYIVVAMAVLAVPSSLGVDSNAVRVEAGPAHIEDDAGRMVLFLRPGSHATTVVPHTVVLPGMSLCRGSVRVSFALETDADVDAFLLTSSITQPIGETPVPIAVADQRMSHGWDARVAVTVPPDAPSGPRVLRLAAQAVPTDASGCDLDASAMAETRVVVLVVGHKTTLGQAREMEVVVRRSDPVGPWRAHETPGASAVAAVVAVVGVAALVGRMRRGR